MKTITHKLLELLIDLEHAALELHSDLICYDIKEEILTLARKNFSNPHKKYEEKPD